ncbi:MAG: flagellar biosynthesis protein FlhF [Planctomycetes bacterium]|nr:flagellar biosynthesis protein FlhF [Planctomycetota bacterium]
MADALGKVKQAFGRDAVILSTRTVPASVVFGRERQPTVEITAARDDVDLPGGVAGGTFRRNPGSEEKTEGAVRVGSRTSKCMDDRASSAIMTEVGSLKSLVNQLLHETRSAHLGGLPDGLIESYTKLVENAVTERIARQLVTGARRGLSEDQLRDPSAVRSYLARAVESMLPVAGPIQAAQDGAPTVVALVGPTGVGKTTTIAKLAANFRLRENRKVGLITIDTYRIAAVEQLRTYAEIIEVPLEVVTSPPQLERALARMADRDYIFIDTAGRSQKDTAKLDELASFFSVRRPDEVHLVLSGSCGEAVLLSTIEAFSGIGIDRIIFTKLDEAIGFGVMLACLDKTEARLSYVTTGQDVPDDIRVGEGGALARLIVGDQAPGKPLMPVTPPSGVQENRTALAAAREA